MFKKHALAEAGGRPARPQGFPAFIAKGYFGGVGLVRGAYTEYVSTPRARPACAKPLLAFVATSAKEARWRLGTQLACLP